MAFIPPETIEKARQVDLLTYLKVCEPNELVHISGNHYCTREHDSLKISNGKWYWFSRGFGGYNALDYLVKVKEGKLSSQVQHRFADKLYRGKVVQTLSWPVVDQIQDSIQLRVRNLCEISSSWKEETKQPVHILVAASLPGRMCIRKINLNFQGLFQFPEAKKFCSVI